MNQQRRLRFRITLDQMVVFEALWTRIPAEHPIQHEEPQHDPDVCPPHVPVESSASHRVSRQREASCLSHEKHCPLTLQYSFVSNVSSGYRYKET
ncbi:hypothetical protein CRG98_034617 [Punica granatum]|nr:hypothetical protein CRG98_034617 [Punica granatum]